MTIRKNMVAIKLIVTCLNEEGNVQEFINELMDKLSTHVNLALLLINNGSTDKTGSVIDSLAQQYPSIITIHREKPLEYGHSILDALAYPMDFSPDYIGWAPSDNQISGEDVAKTIDALIEEKPDFIKVIRYEKNYSLWRKIQSYAFNIIVSFFFMTKINDINGSPKFFRTDFLPILDLQSKGWFLDGEVFLKILRLVNKSNITSISVKFNEREHGKSSTSLFTAFELLINVLHFRFWRIRKWAKKVSYPKETSN